MNAWFSVVRLACDLSAASLLTSPARAADSGVTPLGPSSRRARPAAADQRGRSSACGPATGALHDRGHGSAADEVLGRRACRRGCTLDAADRPHQRLRWRSAAPTA